MPEPPTPARTYAYTPEVRSALARHGLVPKPGTSPERLREYLNDFYRHDLRRLRDRLLRQEFPRREYASRVSTLRRRYALLSLPVSQWTTGDAPGGAGLSGE